MCAFYTVAPPRIIVHPDSKSVSVLEDVTLTCEAEGVEVKYKWRRHNGIIRSDIIDQRNLTIHQFIPSDEDQYYCVATNIGGTNVSKNSRLAINGEIFSMQFVLYNSMTLYRVETDSIKFDSR